LLSSEPLGLAPNRLIGSIVKFGKTPLPPFDREKRNVKSQEVEKTEEQTNSSMI
jgi:hypothetical protein